jgi:hypothetical protein
MVLESTQDHPAERADGSTQRPPRLSKMDCPLYVDARDSRFETSECLSGWMRLSAESQRFSETSPPALGGLEEGLLGL